MSISNSYANRNYSIASYTLQPLAGGDGGLKEEDVERILADSLKLGRVHIEADDQSSSPTTGSLTTEGGVGVAKSVHIGEKLDVASTEEAVSVTSGAITTAGGVGVGGNAYVRRRVYIESGGDDDALNVAGGATIAKRLNVARQANFTHNIASTSTTTGTVVVPNGGVGVGGDVNVGAAVNAASVNATGSITAGTMSATDITTDTVTATGEVSAGSASIAGPLVADMVAADSVEIGSMELGDSTEVPCITTYITPGQPGNPTTAGLSIFNNNGKSEPEHEKTIKLGHFGAYDGGNWDGPIAGLVLPGGTALYDLYNPLNFASQLNSILELGDTWFKINATKSGAIITSGTNGTEFLQKIEAPEATITGTVTADTVTCDTLNYGSFSFGEDPVSIVNTTDATSTTSGALTIAGGIGVEKSLHANEVYAKDISRIDPEVGKTAHLSLDGSGMPQVYVENEGKIVKMVGDSAGPRVELENPGSSMIRYGWDAIYIPSSEWGFMVSHAKSGGQAVHKAWDSNVWTTSSDITLKRDVTPLTYGLAEINQLAPIFYNYNTDLPEKTRRQGFSAQDVQQVIPECIGEDPDGKLTLATTDLIPALVNAIKELSQQVVALTARVEQLETPPEPLAPAAKSRKRKQPASSSLKNK